MHNSSRRISLALPLSLWLFVNAEEIGASCSGFRVAVSPGQPKGCDAVRRERYLVLGLVLLAANTGARGLQRAPYRHLFSIFVHDESASPPEAAYA